MVGQTVILAASEVITDSWGNKLVMYNREQIGSIMHETQVDYIDVQSVPELHTSSMLLLATCIMIGSVLLQRLKRRIANTIIVIIAVLMSCNLGYAAPGDTSDLGWIERSSVGDVLPGLGYSGMTCTAGKKTEDIQGYHIIANCLKGDDRYLVDMWVSLDWTKGHVNSVTKRN